MDQEDFGTDRGMTDPKSMSTDELIRLARKWTGREDAIALELASRLEALREAARSDMERAGPHEHHALEACDFGRIRKELSR